MVTASWLVRRAGAGGATGLQRSAPARPKPARENFLNPFFIPEPTKLDKDFWQSTQGGKVQRNPPSAMEVPENQAQYTRAFVPQGRFFFTATLLEGRRKFLTEPMNSLQVSFLAAGQRRPFTVEASGYSVCLKFLLLGSS